MVVVKLLLSVINIFFFRLNQNGSDMEIFQLPAMAALLLVMFVRGKRENVQ